MKLFLQSKQEIATNTTKKCLVFALDGDTSSPITMWLPNAEADTYSVGAMYDCVLSESSGS